MKKGPAGGDEKWMSRALALARKGKGRTAPNPAVGAVIVKNGRIVGEGWHKKAGEPHAEALALLQAGPAARGASVYVTLEPCNHHGRTGPCAQALIQARVREVFIGARDLSPKPGPRGMEALKRAGVKVAMGPLAAECLLLVEDFSRHSSTGLPFVTVKFAMTLDGKIAAKSGDGRWISSEKSRRMVHSMRNQMDAVMIGADTAMADDPELTVRGLRGGRNPLRAVVDGRLRLPLNGRLARTAAKIPTVVFTTTSMAAGRKAQALRRLGAQVEAAGKGARVDLRRALAILGKMNVMSLLVESGGVLAWELARKSLVDEILVFVAPKIVGGGRCAMGAGGMEKMAQALDISGLSVVSSGPDVLLRGRLDKGR